MTTNPDDDQPQAPAEPQIPTLFATIHHRSNSRPDGYTTEEIAELNRIANTPAGDAQ